MFEYQLSLMQRTEDAVGAARAAEHLRLTYRVQYDVRWCGSGCRRCDADVCGGHVIYRLQVGLVVVMGVLTRWLPLPLKLKPHRQCWALRTQVRMELVR